MTDQKNEKDISLTRPNDSLGTDSLPEELKSKSLTPRQEKFLDVLFNEGAGNIRASMKLAGYAPTTPTKEVVVPLSEHIKELTKQYMASYGPEAMLSLVNVMHDPTQPGANVRMNAAEKVLDRGGIAKGEQIKQEGQIQNIFILPPKGFKQEQVKEVMEVEDVEYEDITEEGSE